MISKRKETNQEVVERRRAARLRAGESVLGLMSQVQTSEAPARQRILRSDASEWRWLAGIMEPGQWVVVPNVVARDVRNRLTSWRKLGLVQDMCVYVDQDGRHIMYAGNMPGLRAVSGHDVEISSGPPPARASRRAYVSKFARYRAAAEALKPGEHFVVSRDQVRGVEGAVGQWRKRYNIKFKVYKCDAGLVIMRPPE